MATMDVKDASGGTVAIEKPLAPGRAAAAASRPVVLSTEDLAAIGAVTETAPASDTASSGLNGRLQRVAERLTSLIALLPAAIGPTAKAGALSVTTATDDPSVAATGIVTETAPASDTASSGLNGRLQRIAQRITSLIALLPTALGQSTMANSLRVVIASDQSTLVTGGNVASAASDSGNPHKIGGVYNTSPAAVSSGQRRDVEVDAVGSLRSQVVSAAVTGADAVANSALAGALAPSAHTAVNRPFVVGGYVFNGTTWDRMRSAGSALGLLVENGPYSYSRKTADGQVKATAGFIHTVAIAPLTATPTAGLLTIYDSASESGTVIYSEWIFATDPGHSVTFDCACLTGIYVGFDGTLANVQVTVSYR